MSNDIRFVVLDYKVGDEDEKYFFLCLTMNPHFYQGLLLTPSPLNQSVC